MEAPREEGEERRSRPRRSFREAEELFDGLDDPIVEERPEPAPRRPKRRQGMRGETAKRILVAIPWIAFAIAIVVAGGLVFTIAMIAIGVLALHEYFAMTEEMKPIEIGSYAAVAALVLAAHFGTSFNVLTVLAASFLVLFVLGADRGHRDGITVSMGVSLLGVDLDRHPSGPRGVAARTAQPRRRAAGRRARRHLRHRHRGVRHGPHVRQPPDRAQPLAQQDA